MKERLVRGSQIASVLRVLRAHRKSRPLPELGPWEQDLLRRQVAPSTWYALKVFDSLLQVVHRFVFDGSESAAQNMGRSFARARLAELPHMVERGDPLTTLSGFAVRWREHFNFGDVLVTRIPEHAGSFVRVRIAGYPDMSACHGHAIMGFTLELVEQAGASAPELRIEERPWMHNSVLAYTLRWT